MDPLRQHIKDFGEFMFSKGYDTAVQLQPGPKHWEDLYIGKVPDALTQFFSDPDNAAAVKGVDLSLSSYINFDPIDWDRLDRGGEVDIDWKPVRFDIHYKEQEGFTVNKFAVSSTTRFENPIELTLSNNHALPSAKQAWELLYPPKKQRLEMPRLKRKQRFKL
ncbi:MAG: hypothetical protein J0I32_08860 [Sphingobacteriales bacterium]|nr:hypothetical protein [Sphingobacteriales bacterium]OJW00110.1 MAG: hypothetical protein BGO52_03205 [Sphingobacteriales bacterium 44-61]